MILFRNILICFLFILSSCADDSVPLSTKEVVETPEEVDEKAEDLIRGMLTSLLDTTQRLPDSLKLANASIMQGTYLAYAYKPLWSNETQYYPSADSLIQWLDSSANYGLFPEDYRLAELKNIFQQNKQDTTLDAARWMRSDLMFTSAFIQICKHLRKGRMIPDSVWNTQSFLKPDSIHKFLNLFRDSGALVFTRILEPEHPEYHRIKDGLQKFLREKEVKRFTYIRQRDSLKWPLIVSNRLGEELDSIIIIKNDSTSLSNAIRKYQKKKGIKADGKLGPALVNSLNNNAYEKFLKAAITLDKWKELKPLPKQHIWVNIPSYYMAVKDSDTVVLRSRIVVGKPETKTPVLNSYITDMITYPKWHIPESIIKQDILPGLKRDPGYTIRKGYTLVDKDGVEVDPYSVNWSKFTKFIPYKVIQGSGDANALGVLKFNFPNTHSVYLHDTNQRYLFSKTSRALSHGCVRVQQWNELANYLLKQDSLAIADTNRIIRTDSLSSWLARKEKHVIPVRKRMPLFIRYLTCESGKEGLVFHDDIYGEDRRLRERYFNSK